MLTPQTVWRFSVAADIDINVFDLYFLIWSLSRLLCCVGSGFNVAAALSMGLFRSPRILQLATNFRVGISVLRTPLILERCRQQKHEVDLLSKFGRPAGRTTRSLINSGPKSSHEPLKQRNSAILSSNTCKPALPFPPANVCIRGISPRGVFGVNKHLTSFNFATSRVT